MKFNGAIWENVGSPGFSAGEALYCSLAINGGGTPYLVYQDGGYLGKATVMKFNGSTWENVGNPGFSDGIVAFVSLAINGSNIPYVAYLDHGNSN